MSIASVKQSLMNGVAVVHRISCTAIEPRHGRGGTARHTYIYTWVPTKGDAGKPTYVLKPRYESSTVHANADFDAFFIAARAVFIPERRRYVGSVLSLQYGSLQ
jgi:hypothetical protein